MPAPASIFHGCGRLEWRYDPVFALQTRFLSALEVGGPLLLCLTNSPHFWTRHSGRTFLPARRPLSASTYQTETIKEDVRRTPVIHVRGVPLDVSRICSAHSSQPCNSEQVTLSKRGSRWNNLTRSSKNHVSKSLKRVRPDRAPAGLVQLLPEEHEQKAPQLAMQPEDDEDSTARLPKKRNGNAIQRTDVLGTNVK